MFRGARSGSLFLLLACSCGGPAAKPATQPRSPVASARATSPGDAIAALAAVPAPSATLSPAASPPAEPSESPGYAETMAKLRPPAVESALQALEAAPADAQAYARAMLAYAATDVPAMALLWGMTYQALGGGKDDAAVASALAKVLAERILVSRIENTDRVDYHLRLAPGQTPARKDADGSVHAPVAHVFERIFGTAVMGYRPPWTVEQFYDALSTWAGLISTKGTPLDEKLELNAWLVTAAKAGHLEAYCHQLLGPAFVQELKTYKVANARALRAYHEYLKTNAFKPTRAVMPDDLVRVQ